MARYARIVPTRLRVVVLLLGVLVMAGAAPLDAQSGLKILEPADITVFIENGEGSTDAAILVSNEGGAVAGTLRVNTFLQASSPANFTSSPVCVSVGGSQCVSGLQTEFAFAGGTITSIPLTINVAPSSLQYGEATLVVLFEQDTTPDNGTVVANPLTFSEYRKVFFVPSLYVQDVMITALIFAAIILALAVGWFFVRERPHLYRGLQHPLGQMSWGTQSWTAFLTALVSTISVVTLSGGSAGISVSAFSVNVYAPTLTILGILFSGLPVLAVFLYRLFGRWSNNSDPQGGNLLGYIVGSALIVFALVGSVLISSNVIQMLVLSTLGITDPPMIPVYLLGVTTASGIVIFLVGVYFIAGFRSDLASQLRDQQKWREKAATEAMLIGVIQASWQDDKVESIPALLALQVLPDYDLGITPIPPDDETIFRSIDEGVVQPQSVLKPDTRNSPKIRI